MKKETTILKNEIRKLKKINGELIAAVSIAMNYVGDDMYHYDDVNDDEAFDECQRMYNRLSKVYKKAKKQANATHSA